MATAAIAGYSGFLYAGTTGAAVKVAELREWTVTTEMSEIDATSHDSSGYREVIAGIRSWSGSAEYLFVAAATNQTQLHDILVGGTKGDFEFYPAGSSATFPIYTGEAYMTSWEISGPNEDAIAASIGFVGTGVLTQTTA
jgi:TP901-1 family phage major tail protein